jgi:fido (protein-threonine AMPylation protein)
MKNDKFRLPFPNGNGRHARLMTDLILEQVLNQTRFTWGSENIVHTTDSRSRYIRALHAADRNDFSLLVEFVRS